MSIRMTRQQAAEWLAFAKSIGAKCYIGTISAEYEYSSKTGANLGNVYQIGYNSGVYGWNFSLFEDRENGNIIISAYRNAPVFEYDARL